MLHKIKVNELTQKQYHLMFVSIAIIILGLLLWFCFMFVIATPVNCHMPDEFWSRTDSALPSVLSLFSIAFFLLFILNAVFFYVGKKEQAFRESFVTSTALILNAVLITTIGLILINLVVSNHNYRISYESKIETIYASNNSCLHLEPFFGDWTIVENTEINSVFEEYISITRNETLKTKNADLYLYSASVELFDKYFLPNDVLQSAIPESYKINKPLRGVLETSFYVKSDSTNVWKHVSYYFEKSDQELVLVKVKLVRKGLSQKYFVYGEYIAMQRIE